MPLCTGGRQGSEVDQWNHSTLKSEKKAQLSLEKINLEKMG